ncbi:MAG: HIT family hydrolase [Acidimicrobiia bacterium]
MDRLWASWRMAYIEGASAVPSGEEACIFCELPNAGNDREAMLVARRPSVFAVLNIYPYNVGHTMVAPYAHASSIEELDSRVRGALMELCGEVVAALRRAYSPDGFNLGMNLGRVAGAGFPGHLHMHIVPRWSGDTNFMPVVADTKVLPEDLRTTYEKLTAALGDLEQNPTKSR